VTAASLGQGKSETCDIRELKLLELLVVNTEDVFRVLLSWSRYGRSGVSTDPVENTYSAFFHLVIF